MVVTLLLFGTSATDVVVTVQTKDGSACMYYTHCKNVRVISTLS